MKKAILVSTFAFIVIGLSTLIDGRLQNFIKPLSKLPPLPKGHYVINCAIYNEEFQLIKNFGGTLCVFLEDGAYILSNGHEEFVAKYNSLGELIWKRNYFAHHNMTLSYDHKRVLFLSSEVFDEKICRVRDDVFVILDVQTGKTFLQKSARPFHQELFDLSDIDYPMFKRGYYLSKIRPEWRNTNCEATHFNSFYEVPPNEGQAKLLPLEAGNFITSTANTPYFFIFNRDLSKIITAISPLPKPWVQIHDAHITADGNILYYLNESMNSGGKRSFSVAKFDLIRFQNNTIFPNDKSHQKAEDSLSFSIWAGSADELSDSYLVGHNDSVHGGMIVLMNKQGQVIRTIASPTLDAKTNKPNDIQSVKYFDLTQFLQNNKL